MIKRPIAAFLFVVGLVAVASAQTSGACNRECLIGLTEAYLSAMVARDPAKAPVIANVRFTQNTRPSSRRHVRLVKRALSGCPSLFRQGAQRETTSSGTALVLGPNTPMIAATPIHAAVINSTTAPTP